MKAHNNKQKRDKGGFIMDSAAQLKALPPTRLTSHLVNLLEQEAHFADKIAKQAASAYYSQGGTRESEVAALTELVNLNERRCMHYRNSADNMCRAMSANAVNTGTPMPVEAGFSHGIVFSYTETTNTLRVRMPVLLPLKPTWNNYLPDKVRRSIEKFSREYTSSSGKKIYFAHALVILIHHYDDEKRVRNHYRDYDNQEWSWTLNALHSRGMFNDNAACMIALHMASPDAESFTEVVITDAERMLGTLRDIVPGLDTSIYDQGGGWQ